MVAGHCKGYTFFQVVTMLVTDAWIEYGKGGRVGFKSTYQLLGLMLRDFG